MERGARVPGHIPARAGVGLKAAHYRAILETHPGVGFFEVHAENYMGAGGPPHRYLEAVRAGYPLSLHGVGLSLGSSEDLDREHLGRLKFLVARYEPGLVSEHLAWSTHDGNYFADLLPIPYVPETFGHLRTRIDEVQSALRRRILIENPSTYLRFAHDTLAEAEFLGELAATTGCGLLLDVNNVLVSAVNQGASPFAYIDAFPLERVEEIHLAGYGEVSGGNGGTPMLIDDHGSAVRSGVWELYEYVLRRRGPIATLVEWDNGVPEWPVLLAQARRAETLIAECPGPPAVRENAHAAHMA